MKRALFAVLALVVLSAPGADAAIVDVSIAGFTFTPQHTQVNAGDAVRWTNNESTPIFHTSTSGVGITPDGTWDSGYLSQAQSYSFTFSGAGFRRSALSG